MTGGDVRSFRTYFPQPAESGRTGAFIRGYKPVVLSSLKDMPNRSSLLYGSFQQTRWSRNGQYLGITTHQYTQSAEQSVWNRSSKVNGKLVLKPQAATMSRGVCESWKVNPVFADSATVSPPGVSLGTLPPGDSGAWAAIDNQALARFNGKLRKGSASLGVTAASWAQTRDMIVARHRHVSEAVDSTVKFLRSSPGALKKLRKNREPLANQVLETEFGWKPLFEDIKAGLENLCQGAPVEYTRSRAKGYISSESTSVTPNSHSYFEQYVGTRWTTYSARVQVVNQNVWLLNRLGLINPVAVIWDLVPWSFVVNMFVNANQLINSITDEVGLQVTDRSITRGRVFRLNAVVSPISTFRAGGRSSTLYRTRVRTIDTALSPSLQLKVPDLNWELAVIASSLAVQKIQKLNRLIRLV